MTTGRKQFKFCKKCQQSKALAEYYIRSTGRVEAWCKPCSIADANRRKAEKRRIARETRAALPAPASPTSQQCRQCGETKPVSEFYKRGASYRSECRECSLAYQAEWRSRPGNREASAARSREYADINREKTRTRKLAKYGLTVAQYDALYDAQQGSCLICGRLKARVGFGGASRSEVLCVDHDHSTGRVRGLLCTACNGGIGLLGDNRDRLARAIHYLEKSQTDGDEGRTAGGAGQGQR